MTLEVLKQEMRTTLESNILGYWLKNMRDEENGGFYGQIDGNDRVVPEAVKGAVLNARILWAFSAAYRVEKKPEYLAAATRAKDYILRHFIDKEYGGVFWSVDARGNPADRKKQTYAIGFAIYGLSEYARATADPVALDTAVGLYYDIEQKAFDAKNNGYVEALTREWKPIMDMRLSEKDENGSRTMNTHLHVIEPYTNLYRIWKNKTLEKRLRNLIDIFLDKILNPETSHLDLFFDDEWQGKRNIQSFGHDIEAVWLLHETALVLEDQALLARVEDAIRRIAAAAEEGLRPDGSMIYERWTDTGAVDTQRQWWVMCESVIGYLDLYQHFGDTRALDIARQCWTYTKTHLIDNVNGEWYWSCDENGKPNKKGDKAGFWKCPYHNARMCLEVIERFSPSEESRAK
ncbi:AGE family epimerase/isomerase [Prevotella sp. A2931]|uniref:Cellobiose 2-epimerase n=1 Tax=Prevotella illustrans TaxID=2800387 RepID=A0ABS3M642_9BACT|nr:MULTISPECIES: AGE family epimerase/isomerase [Prevotella]MBO1363657.1 AGE family epimerase/isomerase [Prevotella illustrans]